MGRPQFVSAGLTRSLGGAVALLLGLAACGEPESLLVAGDVEGSVYGADAGGGYGPSSTNEADFGSIAGVVRFEGTPIKQRNLKLSDNFCINANPDGIASEDFLFDPQSGALEGVFVYIEPKGIPKKIADRNGIPSEPVVLDQVNCQYVPHLAFIRVGQPLVVKSADNTLHNVKMTPPRNEGFNQTINSPGSLAPRTFDAAESEPTLVKCDVHGWMRAYLAILPHPYCVITGKDGAFKLPDVPPGRYKLVFWHEKLGKMEQDVDLENKQDLQLEPVVFKRN